MSIGQGEGEGKALKAIQQALNHPLLETASLENAAGVLINFTCGDDLSLLEVEDALNFLHEQAGSQAEIVFGVVTDECLSNSTEVILVVTGLGAIALEDTLTGYKSPKENDARPVLEEVALPVGETKVNSKEEPSRRSLTSEANLPQSPNLSQTNNLDLPAFLRRPR